jgi:site-specific DNA recombinase
MGQPSEGRCVRAGAYYRISQYRGDGGEAPAIERQRQLCRALAERKGWAIVAEYTDQDVSAYSGKPRPAYERMLAAMESGEVNAVVVLDQDRLVRRMSELESFIELADARRVALATAEGDTDLSTSDGRFKARILGAVARQESEKKSERQRRQQYQAARAGRPQGGQRPYGWQPGGIRLEPVEAERLREAARRVLAGESVAKIAREWTQAGVPTANGVEGWDGSTLRGMLMRGRSAGLREYHGEVVAAGVWEPLWDRETYERLRVVFGRRGQRKRGRPRKHLLTGLLVCECGYVMTSTTKRVGEQVKRRYICAGRTGTKACGGVAVLAEPLERFVCDAVITALTTGGKLQDAIEAARVGDSRTVEAAATIQRCEAKLDSLAADYAEDLMSRAEWLAAREVVDRRLAEARKVLESVAGNGTMLGLPKTEAALRQLLDSSDVDRSRAVLRGVIERIVVHKAARRRWSAPAERIDIDWRV